MTRVKRCVAIVAGVAVAACSHEAPVAPFRPVADSTALSIGEPLYACGHWASGTGPRLLARLTVDLHFRPDTAFRGPTDADIEALTARGATILYRFSFPAVRVAINAARIPTLVDSGLANAAVSVPNPSRYDWRFIVAVADTLTSSDSLYIVGIGGRVRSMLRGLSFIVADLPDGSITYLLRWSRLRFAENDAFACLATGRREPQSAAQTSAESTSSVFLTRPMRGKICVTANRSASAAIPAIASSAKTSS